MYNFYIFAISYLLKTKNMEAINILVYPKNNSQIEAIEAVMKALKIKFQITNGNKKQMSQQEFVQWIEDAEQSPNMTLEKFNEKWDQKKREILK